jgi:hypothetical protein
MKLEHWELQRHGMQEDLHRYAKHRQRKNFPSPVRIASRLLQIQREDQFHLTQRHVEDLCYLLMSKPFLSERNDFLLPIHGAVR